MSQPRFLLSRYPNDKAPRPVLIPRKNIPWEASAVFNCAVVKYKQKFIMLYRAYGSQLKLTDPKLYRPGHNFDNQASYIGIATSKDGYNFVPKDEPFIKPDEKFDGYGCEDPRITKLEDTYYITYTAIDAPLQNPKYQPNIRIALASTQDFSKIKKHGIIGPPTSSKASALFPESVNQGKIGLALTISPDSTNSYVAVRYFDSIEHLLKNSKTEWQKFLKTSASTTFLKTDWWLHRGPELGAPPIKTKHGWLFIFSAESMSDTWTVSAALTELKQPHKLIARAPSYLLQPVTRYEIEGLVPHVTFPSAAVIKGKDLLVYYGAADTVIGLASCKLDALLSYLLKFSKNH